MIMQMAARLGAIKPQYCKIFTAGATNSTGMAEMRKSAAAETFSSFKRPVTILSDKVVGNAVKELTADKEVMGKFVVTLAEKWVADEPIVISAADGETLKKYFAAKAKALLDKGVTIEEVNGQKALFTIQPADGSYKVNFGEEEFVNFFQSFLRPELVEMLF